MSDDSPPPPPPQMPHADKRQRIVLVTGLSGAGKSTALQVLEDLGWETIDNFPIRFLGRFLGEAGDEHETTPLAIGFDTRTRGFVPTDIMALVKELSARGDLAITTLFLDCASGELERRYNETRRPHPMAKDREVQTGIKAERELLEPLRRWADAVVDTSLFNTHQLQQAIRESFAERTHREMSVIIYSFGFARGTPPLADLVFDMRYIDNPHWVSELRELTGLDEAVGAHIENDPAFGPSFAKIRDLLLSLLPHYKARGKSYVTIAFGCTGGRHRSVYSACKMDEALREAGIMPTLIHRNLSSRAADMIEGNNTENQR